MGGRLQESCFYQGQYDEQLAELQSWMDSSAPSASGDYATPSFSLLSCNPAAKVNGDDEKRENANAEDDDDDLAGTGLNLKLGNAFSPFRGTGKVLGSGAAPAAATARGPGL